MPGFQAQALLAAIVALSYVKAMENNGDWNSNYVYHQAHNYGGGYGYTLPQEAASPQQYNQWDINNLAQGFNNLDSGFGGHREVDPFSSSPYPSSQHHQQPYYYGQQQQVQGEGQQPEQQQWQYSNVYAEQPWRGYNSAGHHSGSNQAAAGTSVVRAAPKHKKPAHRPKRSKSGPVFIDEEQAAAAAPVQVATADEASWFHEWDTDDVRQIYASLEAMFLGETNENENEKQRLHQRAREVLNDDDAANVVHGSKLQKAAIKKKLKFSGHRAPAWYKTLSPTLRDEMFELYHAVTGYKSRKFTEFLYACSSQDEAYMKAIRAYERKAREEGLQHHPAAYLLYLQRMMKK